MRQRSVEDLLREEYFDLLPAIRTVVEALQTEVRYALLPIVLQLSTYERLEVTSRVKDCESAIGALKRRQEGTTFDGSKPDQYSLTRLKDLAGVRVLVFPRAKIKDVDLALRPLRSEWTEDHLPAPDTDGPPIALKYHGYYDSSHEVQGEIQVVPFLTGLFWQIEHSALYKPTPELKGVVASLEMQSRYRDVLKALNDFEDEFQRVLEQSA